MGDINWDVEVRKLEREFIGLPPEPSTVQRQSKLGAERRAHQQRNAAHAKVGATARLALVAALFGALFIWPYQHACGFGLIAYMGVLTVIAAAALWVVTFTWEHRLARSHAAAFGLLLGALTLLAAQVLPRIGIDRVDRMAPKQWWCASK